MVHHNVCPICASENIGLQFSCKDYFTSSKNFAIFKVYSVWFPFHTQDYPEENEIAEITNRLVIFPITMKLKAFPINVSFCQERYDEKEEKKLSGKLPWLKQDFARHRKRNRIFAGTMKKAGWLAKGIEINERARKFSISHFGLDVATP